MEEASQGAPTVREEQGAGAKSMGVPGVPPTPFSSPQGTNQHCADSQGGSSVPAPVSEHWSRHPLISAVVGSGILAAVVAFLSIQWQSESAKRDRQHDEFVRNVEWFDKWIEQYEASINALTNYHTYRLWLVKYPDGAPVPPGGASRAEVMQQMKEARETLIRQPPTERLRKRLKARYPTTPQVEQNLILLENVEAQMVWCNDYDQTQGI